MDNKFGVMLGTVIIGMVGGGLLGAIAGSVLAWLMDVETPGTFVRFGIAVSGVVATATLMVVVALDSSRQRY